MQSARFIVLLLCLSWSVSSCGNDGGRELFETAQFEEKQNNPAHAKELYREIMQKYPQSEYSKRSEERLRALDAAR